MLGLTTIARMSKPANATGYTGTRNFSWSEERGVLISVQAATVRQGQVHFLYRFIVVYIQQGMGQHFLQQKTCVARPHPAINIP